MLAYRGDCVIVDGGRGWVLAGEGSWCPGLADDRHMLLTGILAQR